MGHKYGAVRSEYRGEVYASKAERDYAMLLDAMKAEGKITDWKRGEPLVIVPGPRRDRVTYVPDFTVQRPDGSFYLVEVKGYQTPVWRLKRKLLRYLLPDVKLLVVDAAGVEVTA